MTALRVLPSGSSPDVTVQLLNTDGVCWEAVYSTASKNTAGPPGFFKAKAD